LADPTYSFFFYGTLMDRAVLNLVSGIDFTAMQLQPATLRDFQRYRVKDVQYPGIVPSEGDHVSGVIVRGITQEAATRLDHFENDGYDRENVTVETKFGRQVNAAAYIASNRMVLEEEPWDFDAWKKRHRNGYVERVRGWARRYRG